MFYFPPYRIGFKAKKQYRHYLYTNVLEHKNTQHEIESFHDMIRMLGVTITKSLVELKTTPNGENQFNELCNILNLKSNSYIIIHPGCGKDGDLRCWDEKNFIEIIKFILKNSNLDILITGTESEKHIIKNVFAPFSEEKRVHNLLNKINLDCLISAIKNTKFIICGNTGVMHIASALNTPLIAIHGPTNYKQWGPIGTNSIIIKSNEPCAPCLDLGFDYGCNKKTCLNSISVDTVKNAFKKLISN